MLLLGHVCRTCAHWLVSGDHGSGRFRADKNMSARSGTPIPFRPSRAHCQDSTAKAAPGSRTRRLRDHSGNCEVHDLP